MLRLKITGWVFHKVIGPSLAGQVCPHPGHRWRLRLLPTAFKWRGFPCSAVTPQRETRKKRCNEHLCARYHTRHFKCYLS